MHYHVILYYIILGDYKCLTCDNLDSSKCLTCDNITRVLKNNDCICKDGFVELVELQSP